MAVRFQLTGDIMGSNITKMCTSAKPDPKFNSFVALKPLQLLYKGHGQNKNVSINCAQEDLGVATLYCICRMKEHPSIGFFVVARGQSSDVVTWNGYDTQDLLAMSRDNLLLDINRCYTLSEILEQFLLVLVYS